ncbi:MAG: tRNA threonylcarbamoyladenosine dehydratase [Ruminococcaceae bacterium]|nr:tRNA threonylcarbamoyladenosine dehydratase [Oscillospiraceae bacterium]
MNNEEMSRTAALLGGGACDKLKSARVAVFGVGGVGGFICEALARAGIGALDIYDADTVAESNINRQIIALRSTLGRAKVDVMKARIADINPDCKVTAHKVFYLPKNADEFSLDGCDYIADAVDTVAAKVELARRADALGIPMISAMGTGNKLDPTKFEVAYLSKTDTCPLARAVRKQLRPLGIDKKLKVVYSREAAKTNDLGVIGSVSFVPSVAGLIIAGEIIKDLIK